MASLVVAYAVDFQSDLLSGAAPVPAASPEDFWRVLSSLSVTGRIRSEPVSGSVLCEEMGLDESACVKLFHTVGLLITRGHRAGGW